MSTSTAVVWFRRDLRLEDNPAWAAATNEHDTVAALYVLDDTLLRAAGPYRRRQLLAELAALDATLREYDGRLLVRRGDAACVVVEETRRLGARTVYWNDDVTPYATGRDATVRAALVEHAVPVRSWFGHLVLAPGSVRTNSGAVSRVFGAFHRRWATTDWDPWPVSGDARLLHEAGDALPTPDAPPPLEPGTDAAHARLERFLTSMVDDYPHERDVLARAGTSGLSVALRFGTISPRQVVEAAGGPTASASRAATSRVEGAAAFVRQVAWRDWYAHLLWENPSLAQHAQRPEYDRIAWREDPDGFAAWQEGRTGYPVVDAGMRQLQSTGHMHNRVRMLAASFLVKDLLIDWRRGERHFRRLLVDADVAQNVGNWQWVAGTGPDAAPYFRVFNPITQSRSHDPTGEYLRRWLPELAELDNDAIHAPWLCPPLTLAAAGVTIGDTYPAPIVEHRAARERALAAYAEARNR